MILSKNRLNEWLVALSKYELFGPVQNGDIVTFTALEKVEDVALEEKTDMSPKKVIFPQTETLFKYRIGKKADISVDQPGTGKKVIFGVRPCDARGFAVLDDVFKWDYVDPYYLAARERTILVGMACNSPGINCFCTSLDGGPAKGDNLDILMVELEDGYHVEAITEKGRELIQESSALFTQATSDELDMKETAITNAREEISRNIETNGLVEKLGEIFEDDYWEGISRACIGCGTCTYVCPTCYCFDMQDETQEYGGRRARMWDSCMFPEYTLHTSGHNPRPARAPRLKNRVYHKFKYYHDHFGVHLCVGCGRCVDKCPANIDIIEIVNQIEKIGGQNNG